MNDVIIVGGREVPKRFIDQYVAATMGKKLNPLNYSWFVQHRDASERIMEHVGLGYDLRCRFTNKRPIEEYVEFINALSDIVEKELETYDGEPVLNFIW